uniref:histone deacetylase 15-like n=1 Tax=Erigeron canadensis TaxID=72917 RepID=UPI001CB98DE8|nr:histone deacetylase 15-like [Erigeron canadensis]
MGQTEDTTLEDTHNKEDDFDDEDDSDGDLLERYTSVDHWFCINCTMVNVDATIYCQICGEHKKSGILSHGFLASRYHEASSIKNISLQRNRTPEASCSKTLAPHKMTAVGFDERMLLHFEVERKSLPHSERPDRLRAIAASLATAGIFPGRCHPIPAREITREELQMVHSDENIEFVERTSQCVAGYFTTDTYANKDSALAARLAAGLCADLANLIFSGRAKNGFALVRPPGHHAGVKQATGYCLHNNAAVAASAAQVAGAKKVLIVDWDVHHGNGTQEIFEQNKSVLYISLHRHEGGKFYPFTGAATEVGSMGGEGYCVNVPWSRGGVGDNDYIFAFEHVVLPIAREFAPDITIISAGFDAAKGDILGCCDVTPAGYAQMTKMLTSLSSGKLLVILEGGYNLRSISSSATAVIKVLLGENPASILENVVPSRSGLQTVLDVLKIQNDFWPILGSILSDVQTVWESNALQEIRDAVSHKESSKRKVDETGIPRPQKPKKAQGLKGIELREPTGGAYRCRDDGNENVGMDPGRAKGMKGIHKLPGFDSEAVKDVHSGFSFEEATRGFQGKKTSPNFTERPIDISDHPMYSPPFRKVYNSLLDLVGERRDYVENVMIPGKLREVMMMTDETFKDHVNKSMIQMISVQDEFVKRLKLSDEDNNRLLLENNILKKKIKRLKESKNVEFQEQRFKELQTALMLEEKKKDMAESKLRVVRQKVDALASERDEWRRRCEEWEVKVERFALDMVAIGERENGLKVRNKELELSMKKLSEEEEKVTRDRKSLVEGLTKLAGYTHKSLEELRAAGERLEEKN